MIYMQNKQQQEENSDMIVQFKGTTYLTVRNLFKAIYFFRVMNICHSIGLEWLFTMYEHAIISELVDDNITYIWFLPN